MSNNYPTTAKSLLTSDFRAKDDFFLLAEVKEDGNALAIGIEDDFPIAVNRESVRGAIYEDTGVLLPRRVEVSKANFPEGLSSTVAWERMYTVATGSALWLRSSTFADGDLAYLVQNSADKPVNPSRYNFGSGLVCCDLAEQAFEEMNQETGIFLVCESEGHPVLVGLNFNLPKAMAPALSEDFKQAVLSGKQQQQETYIRSGLAAKHPELKEAPIIWHTLDTDFGHCLKPVVTTSYLGFPLAPEAHVFVDNKARSVNIHFPIIASLDGLDLTGAGLTASVSSCRIITVDPEEFGRNVGLYSLAQARNLDTIPAPRDYFSRLTPS